MLGPLLLAAAGLVFHYDASAGTCLDGQGHAGLNRLDADAVFSSPTAGGQTIADVDAECADLRGFDFNTRIGMNYKTLLRWDLRGANLAGARLHFAVVKDAALDGVDLRAMSVGYTVLTGTVDRFSKFPAGACHTAGDQVSCRW